MTAEASQPTRAVRILRHWKQRFDKGARMRWRRQTTWSQELQFEAGEEIPPEIIKQMGATKLRRFWESHFIELYEFEDPDVGTGQVAPVPTPDPVQTTSDEFDLPEGVTVSGPAAGWYTISDGEVSCKARGKEKVLHVLETIREARAATAEAEAKAQADAEALAAAQTDEGGSAPGNGEE